MIATSNRRAVIGAGISGRSAARYLAARDLPFDWFDTRSSVAELELPEAENLSSYLKLGAIQDDQLCGYSEVILSPGLSRAEPYILAAESSGATVVGDIELFARVVEAPVAAITGSNGKSSVTTLLAEVAKACGRNAVAAGNLGEPVLDQLDRDYDLYVLELSSFQLETTYSLKPAVATILNISPDHMDRYPSMIAYHAAKQRIHHGASVVVSNRDDLLTQPMLADSQKHISFGFDEPDLGQYGLRTKQDQSFVARGLQSLFPASRIQTPGRHNLANAMAVLAMADALQLDRDTCIETICNFKGLPHRCELVADTDGVRWINDSKATNVGAALAAIRGLEDEVSGKLLLIAGGQTKGQDFRTFGAEIAEKIGHLILLGEGADEIELAAHGVFGVSRVGNMQMAVQRCLQVAEAGDCVLLSPACASFDQFKNYQDRGNQFRNAVLETLK